MKAILRLFNRKYDWKAMFLCFLAAALFWLLNAMNRDHSADVQYPIIFKYNNQELTSKSDSEQEIRFQANGQGWDLLKLKLHWFIDPIEVDITNKKRFRYFLTSDLRPYLEDKLPNVEVRYFLMDTLYTGLDKVKKVKMKIYLDREAVQLADGYKIDGNIRISPEYIIATGPSSIMDTLTRKILIHISDKGIAEEYKEEVTLSSSRNKLIQYDADKVEVFFQVTQHKRPFEQ